MKAFIAAGGFELVSPHFIQSIYSRKKFSYKALTAMFPYCRRLRYDGRSGIARGCLEAGLANTCIPKRDIAKLGTRSHVRNRSGNRFHSKLVPGRYDACTDGSRTGRIKLR